MERSMFNINPWRSSESGEERWKVDVFRTTFDWRLWWRMQKNIPKLGFAFVSLSLLFLSIIFATIRAIVIIRLMFSINGPGTEPLNKTPLLLTHASMAGHYINFVFIPIVLVTSMFERWMSLKHWPGLDGPFDTIVFWNDLGTIHVVF